MVTQTRWTQKHKLLDVLGVEQTVVADEVTAEAVTSQNKLSEFRGIGNLTNGIELVLKSIKMCFNIDSPVLNEGHKVLDAVLGIDVLSVVFRPGATSHSDDIYENQVEVSSKLLEHGVKQGT